MIFYNEQWIDFEYHHSMIILKFIHNKIKTLFTNWKTRKHLQLFDLDLSLHIKKIYLIDDKLCAKFYNYLKNDLVKKPT